MNPVKVPVQFFYFDFESKCKSTIVWFGLFYLLVLGLVYYVGEMRTCLQGRQIFPDMGFLCGNGPGEG